MSRKIIPFIVAIVLSCLVMIVAGVFAFSGAVTAEKFGSNVIWNQPYNTAESMKVIDVSGDGQDDLFIQNTSQSSVLESYSTFAPNTVVECRVQYLAGNRTIYGYRNYSTQKAAAWQTAAAGDVC